MSTALAPDAGARDLEAAVDALAARLPEPLRPLARVAYNYRWAWEPGGEAVFRDLDPHRWATIGPNPVRLLTEVATARLAMLADDEAYVARVDGLATAVADDLARPADDRFDAEHPVAFLCAEFGVHVSLPIYSGGLGVLAGDILKAASDLAVPMVGVGLFYGFGYFHQRLDESGWQHEYWTPSDPDLLPAVPVTGDDGQPLVLEVPIRGRDVAARVWRVDVGRVRLFLLDANVAGNSPADTYITGRLYEGSKDLRLSQYAMLGIGGVRTLAALGIDPSLWHLNEGHPALGALELVAQKVADGEELDAAFAQIRERFVFTTHTPVAAGNESYPPEQVLAVVPDLAERLGMPVDELLGLGRVDPADTWSAVGMTPVALRMSRHANGVAARHGVVAREMWAPLFHTAPADTPIAHVTNGVHVGTWLGEPMRKVLDAHFADGWRTRIADPATWEALDDIPDAELWAARCESRRELVEFTRRRSAMNRLERGVDLSAVAGASHALDPDALTIGFARRVASYKRLFLLARDRDRALAFLGADQPVQILIAGKAHPADDGAKRMVQELFDLRYDRRVVERVVFLEDYDMDIGRRLTTGCDVWLNVPRPPLEASGTSGMKVVLNGGLNLSVLDGWWDEGYDGTNGWAIDGSVQDNHDHQDHLHAHALYDRLEQDVRPTFAARDADGIPTAWVARMRASMKTLAWRFSAARMVGDYRDQVYLG